MIHVFVLSPLEEVWERIESLKLNPMVNFSRWNRQMSVSDIKIEDSPFQPVTLIDDTLYGGLRIRNFLHKLRADQSHIILGYLVSYEKRIDAGRVSTFFSTATLPYFPLYLNYLRSSINKLVFPHLYKNFLN